MSWTEAREVDPRGDQVMSAYLNNDDEEGDDNEDDDDGDDNDNSC